MPTGTGARGAEVGALMAEVTGTLCSRARASVVPQAAVVGGRDDRPHAIASPEPARALRSAGKCAAGLARGRTPRGMWAARGRPAGVPSTTGAGVNCVALWTVCGSVWARL